MEGYNNNEFHSYGGNITSEDVDSGFDYPALQDLESKGTFMSFLTSLSDNFAPNVLPLSETSATRVPPMLPSVEDVTYAQWNPQDQLPMLQNINRGNNTDDYRQTQFLVSTANQVAPMLSAEVKLSGSQINHSLSRKDISSKSNDCRRWSEEEHRLFLFGLQKYGKSDWINISRFIKTRNPTQVASHAQKYFIRQASSNKSRRSIHDMVLPDNGPTR